MDHWEKITPPFAQRWEVDVKPAISYLGETTEHTRPTLSLFLQISADHGPQMSWLKPTTWGSPVGPLFAVVSGEVTLAALVARIDYIIVRADVDGWRAWRELVE